LKKDNTSITISESWKSTLWR